MAKDNTPPQVPPQDPDPTAEKTSAKEKGPRIQQPLFPVAADLSNVSLEDEMKRS
jgi:hypothetical protein